MAQQIMLSDLSATEYIRHLQGDAALVCTDDRCPSYPRRVSLDRPYSARQAIETSVCPDCGSPLAVVPSDR